MTRWSIAVLLLLNWALAAWNFGAFSRWGWGPHDSREPERLARQIQPDAVRLRAPLAAAASPAASEASAAAEPVSTAPSSPASDPVSPR